MMSNPETPAGTVLFCARCAAELHPGAGNFYQVAIEAVADPSPPVADAEASADELRRQIEATISSLADLSAQEALDQVYRRLVLHLCTPCFRIWIENPAG